MKILSAATLNAIKVGVLTDEQLAEALDHYLKLSFLLAPHGDMYGLVYRDVRNMYNGLRKMEKTRALNNNNPQTNPT